MAVHPIEYRYGSREMKSVFEETSRLQFFLDVEAAIAKAHAKFGNIPKKDAAEIAKKASTKYVKIERVKEIEREIKHDVMSVVKALSEACGEAGKYVHFGATSYDIVDSANALQFKKAIVIVEKDLKETKQILASLAKKHRDLVAVGRTHGQHATPITYGLKFAVYLAEVRRHLERAEEVKKRILVGKLSGAVGTYAALGKNGMEIEKEVMKNLGLQPEECAMQVVQRDRYAELVLLLALIAGTFDKMAKEIRNLSRTEIAEVSESFGEKQVGSSTMPHKRNPINCERVCGIARVIKSHAFIALENISLEHERDLTNSSAERILIPESFILLDEILKTMKDVLKNLVFHKENIKRNLYATKGLNLAEAVMIELTKKGVPRQSAHELLRKITLKAEKENTGLKELLLENKEVLKYLTKKEIEEVLKPEKYIGLAREKVDYIVRIKHIQNNES